MCWFSIAECWCVGVVELRLGGNSLLLAGDVVVLGWSPAIGVVGPPLVLIVAVLDCLRCMHSIHPVALAQSLRTVAVVAVAPPLVTRQPIDSKHVLGTGVALAVAVLRQVALVLLGPAFFAAGRHLPTHQMTSRN